MPRRELLKKLISFDEQPPLLKHRLDAYGWDSDEELVILHWRDIRSVLERYIAGKLDERQLEAWAELIECREDIGFEPSRRDRIQEVIFELANPYLNGGLTVEKAKGWVRV